MNILYLNTTYQCGGAEKVVSQLFQGMQRRGYNVYQIVSYDTRHSLLPSGVHVLYSTLYMRIWNRLITGNHGNRNLHIGYSRRYILRFIREHQIDLVHLHNPHDNFLGIRDISDIAAVCPMVWTLHDFWVMTGHCTYPQGCDQLWRQGCPQCPRLDNYPAIRVDAAHELWLQKKAAYSGAAPITYTVPSDWMLERFRESHLSRNPCRRIYNSLDTGLWKPLDKRRLREQYGIDSAKRVLAFIASDPAKKLKGMDLLLDALSKLPDPERYLLLVAGKETPGLVSLDSRFEIRHLGYLSSQEQLNEFYSLADLLVNPSVYETFGLTNIEAMASGTPVAAFPVCTMPELIHDDCGWLASEVSASALEETIRAAFADPELLQKKARAGREAVESRFSEDAMLQQFEELYQSVLVRRQDPVK